MAYYSKNLKGIDQKLKCSEMLEPFAFRWFGWQNGIEPKNGALWDLNKKKLSAVGFSGKKSFFLETIFS